MSDKSGIQWTDATWNPVTGCSKVSQGCKNCYALRDWARLAAPRATPNAYTGREFTDVMFHPERLDQPLRWTKPRRVFVNSMSDLFHENMEHHEIEKVFGVMGACPQHTFQVLTKRPERMRELLTDAAFCEMAWLEAEQRTHAEMQWPFPNVWLGVSVEDQATADERIPLLLQTPAAVRFVSYEPALGPVDFTAIKHTHSPGYFGDALQWYHQPHGVTGYPALDWVIVGGESGPKARPCRIEWIESVVRQCRGANVACFVKQIGTNPIWAGAVTSPIAPARGKGGDPAEWPIDLRVREMPR